MRTSPKSENDPQHAGSAPQASKQRPRMIAFVAAVFVHGLPETSRIWDALRRIVERESIAPSLPGFGAARPAGFTATKDAYAEWLAKASGGIEEPIDLVGHDMGALITLRVATAFDVPLRSYAVDVAPLFHPRFEWSERVHRLQTPGIGEQLLKSMREAAPEDPDSTAARLASAGVPIGEAKAIGAAHDETMGQSILDFYRSAVPNVAADWWKDVKAPTPSQGLILLPPDPPEWEAMSFEVADRLGAQTARLDDLNHCWMAEAPERWRRSCSASGPHSRSGSGLEQAWWSALRDRVGDDPPKRRDMAGEPAPPEGCQSRAHPAASLAQRSLDRHVAGFLERRQLLGQRRVGQRELVTDERELRPVGRGQERHDRQPRGRVDELVEPGSVRHPAAVRRIALPRIAAIRRGPPSRIATATSTLAIVAGCPAPSA
jgi:pimeloyl-ACP methyl ester carboxylesterase